MLSFSCRHRAVVTRVIGLAFCARTLSAQSIGQMSYLKTYAANEIVNVYRGQPATIQVLGSFIYFPATLLTPATTTSAQIRTVSGAAATGITVEVLSPSTSAVSVKLTSGETAGLGDYVVSLTIGGNTSVFRVRLNERGTVNSITSQSVSPTPGTAYALVGVRTLLTVAGDHLGQAGVSLSGGLSAEVVSQSYSTMTVGVTVASGHQYSLAATAFYSPASGISYSECAAVCRYDGSGFIRVQGLIDDAITSVAPLNPQVGQLVTLSGRNLAPAGYRVELQYRSRSNPANSKTLALTPTASAITFAAPDDVLADSIFVRYFATATNPEALNSHRIALPAQLNVQPPPALATVTFQLTSVNAGNTVTGTISLTAAPAVSGLSVQLQSSNNALLSVPSSVAMSGQTATFTVKPNSVGAPTPVTITATLGAVTVSKTITVLPPGIRTVTYSKTALSAFDSTIATITLSAVPVSPDTVRFFSSDSSAIAVPTLIAMTAQTATVVLRSGLVGSPTTATVTASTGSSAAAATISVKSLALTMSASPASTVAGKNVMFTLTLSAAVNPPNCSGVGLTGSSSDETVITKASLNPTSARFAPGQTTLTISVPTIAPQTVQKSVAIRYLSRLLCDGVSTTVQSLMPLASSSVTVTP